jgi:muramoyltetrapeptide carboxypeptidase
LIEDLGEHLYRIDRSMFHVTATTALQKIRRLRLGRISDILPNDPDFASDEVTVVEDWCTRSGILFGGRADIGHDAQNRVVPFTREKR